MVSEITDLAFEGKIIRFARNGQLWFVLADVCQALELSHVTETAKRLDEDEKGCTTIATLGGPQEMLIVSEPGLYKLIATSRKPVAQRFDRWVRHEVLPSIRMTGTYGSPSLVPPVQMQAISDLFDQKLEPINKKLSLIVDNTAELLTKGRKDATPETVRIQLKVVRYHYDGKCPCLECSITIADDDGFIPLGWHHHHQNNNNDNRPTAMIPLAIPCHKRIEGNPEARRQFARAFDMFQTLLSRLKPSQGRFDF